MRRLVSAVRRYLAPKAAVLMYHRISDPEADIWEIAVSPANFEQHLQYLKAHHHVVPLQEMVDGLAGNKIRRNSIAITFDDGYADNYLQAKPLLEKYGLPATFFVSSGNIGQETPFWWDELEQLILFTERLPQTYTFQNQETLDLTEEHFLTGILRQKHISWKVCEEVPPTVRAELFFKLWQKLKPLPHAEQQEHMQQIREWAGVTSETKPELKSMTVEQLKDLGQSGLFTIGAHTVSHPALAFHTADYQQRELTQNRTFLRDVTGQDVSLVAYPYGNYNEETLSSVASLKFKAAFTTEETRIQKQANRYRLGRYQVKNLPFQELSSTLRQW
ncbi:polysaccharide deacetylase family protein [Rufibacter hautae]|uniref:Polysaccharide deacetylase family protein n=1 Tax=Rufibacter hautae TaxID=2595005 RepID=A0A5B6TL21_9BACT|nr:polysaccharide deacetylase family protein [Rufibacter hautae]KAA3436792.1 polysaccharide deacetylase family protein [Rufibacter hautae]